MRSEPQERRGREHSSGADGVALPQEEVSFCAGSGETLEALYQTHSPRLVRRFARSTGSKEEARDLVHDLFCRLLRAGAGTLQALDKPEAYLNRIASNLLKDRAKNAVRRASERHVPADEQMLPGPDPHRQLEARDMLARLEQTVLRLRPRTRQIFLAHRVDGLSYAEIAERTGLSVKGVEKQMSKAIAQIDRMLGRS